MNNNDKEREVLLEQFEQLRQTMNKQAARLGVTHPEVIRISQELDRIHIELLKSNEYKSLVKKNSYYMSINSNKIGLVNETMVHTYAYTA